METITGHNDNMKKAVVYTSQRRRTNRARSIQTLLHHHARPHGGNAAERVKQARPHGMTSRLAN
jgi:hypothetical protein